MIIMFCNMQGEGFFWFWTRGLGAILYQALVWCLRTPQTVLYFLKFFLVSLQFCVHVLWYSISVEIQTDGPRVFGFLTGSGVIPRAQHFRKLWSLLGVGWLGYSILLQQTRFRNHLYLRDIPLNCEISNSNNWVLYSWKMDNDIFSTFFL
jgi:hypothetical protein